MRPLKRLRKDTQWQFLEREALRLNKEPVQECVNWKHSLTDRGYGRVKRGDKTYRVHRYAYAIVRGIDLAEIDSLVVRHACDNPACFNPGHLLIGTHQDNAMDRESRGRSNPVKGITHPSSKLTESQVKEVFELLGQGISQARIGEMFGVTQMAISHIKVNRNWRHLAIPSNQTISA